MTRKIQFDWVRKIKKEVQCLEAADEFKDFLTLGLGKPEALTENGTGIKFSLHVTGNVRLIIKLNAEKDSIRSCSEVEIEGVCDYHGSKENWYLS